MDSSRIAQHCSVDLSLKIFIPVPRGNHFSHFFVISFVISVFVDPRFGGLGVATKSLNSVMNGGSFLLVPGT